MSSCGEPAVALLLLVSRAMIKAKSAVTVITPPSAPEASAMRRRLATLFVDIAGSTSLLMHHPPEVVLGVVQGFMTLVTEVTPAHAGTVKDFEGRDQGNFELIVFPSGGFVDDPDQLLAPHTPGSPQNWSRFSNPGVEDLFARQARALDPTERRKLVIELQKIVLENAYYMPGLWSTRNVVHWAKVKNYVAPPSIFTNQKLQDVWLSED